MSKRIWIDDDILSVLRSQSLSVEESPSAILRRIFQREGLLKVPDSRMLILVEEERHKLERSIDELGFSNRIQTCLVDLGVKTVGDLVQTPELSLVAKRNFGRKSLLEVRAKLAELGLSLGLTISEEAVDNENPGF